MATRSAAKPIVETVKVPDWSRLTRAAFRFSFVYLALYSLATQIVGGLLLLPGFSIPSLGTRWPMRNITLWIATHVFGLATPLVYSGNSGDTAFHWIQTVWLLIAAAIVSTVWSLRDREQRHYRAWHEWFRLFLRFALAAQMFYFGMAKVVPTQFPPPSLVTLVEPVGHLSRADLLWTFIGSSPAYQMFTGWAEVFAGILLVIPHTATVGAVVALADTIQVLALNMAYDVGLKQISFHLILIALFLLAPDMPRLASVLIANRSPGTASRSPLFHSLRANRGAFAAQILFGVYLLCMFTRLALISWQAPGGPASPRSPLYGIWDVAQLSVDGEVRSPFSYDYDRRWRRVIFDTPETVVFQRTDDSFAHYGASIDVSGHSLVLRKGNSRTWRAPFAYHRPVAERLVLDGEMDSHTIHLELQRVDFDEFRLLNSGFRWIRPPDPYGG
jgi:uncharacterized membrane protein YphA (DoxX/SURF4 family)